MRSLGALLFVLMATQGAVATKAKMKITINPIRRVVTLMSHMQKKIMEEGKRDEELFEKFMCYCKTGTKDLDAAIEKNSAEVPQLTSSLEESKAKVASLKNELKTHNANKAEAEDALSKATAIREKEAANYAKESAEGKANVAAMKKAIAALNKGMGSSFLQTTEATTMRRLSVQLDLSSSDRDLLTSFLSNEMSTEANEDGSYAPQSGEVVGILKQMHDTMVKELMEAAATEEQSIADFTAMSAAKEREIAANTKAIEKKTARVGNTGIEIVQTGEALKDAETSLAEDTKFIANLKTSCATKGGEFEKIKKLRAQELLALADTIKILNDDDALDLFKKTLPSPALVQMEVTPKEMKQQALKALNKARHHKGHKDLRLDLIALALHGKKVSFDKVIKMVDNMMALLDKEQATDDDKKAYCTENIDKTEDEQKALNVEISDIEKEISDNKSEIAKLAEEIKSLIEGIKELDKSVAEATATRKEEHQEYKDTMAADNAAKELLKMAKNRLNKFYNPKLYKAEAPKAAAALAQVHHAKSVDDEGDDADEDDTDADTYADTSFLQIRARKGVPPPPPETVDAYAKKGEESSGVVAMMDTLLGDLDNEMAQMETEEKDSQKEYEQYLKDSKDKRATDSMAISAKEGAKADREERIDQAKLEKKSKLKESYTTAKKLKDLHVECDWLLKNYDARKGARAGEVEALRNAKAVLSGADFSLLQTGHSHHMRRSLRRR